METQKADRDRNFCPLFRYMNRFLQQITANPKQNLQLLAQFVYFNIVRTLPTEIMLKIASLTNKNADSNAETFLNETYIDIFSCFVHLFMLG